MQFYSGPDAEKDYAIYVQRETSRSGEIQDVIRMLSLRSKETIDLVVPEGEVLIKYYANVLKTQKYNNTLIAY